MLEIRCQKTKEYKEDQSTKLLFLQNDKNALTTFLHSADDLGFTKKVSSDILSEEDIPARPKLSRGQLHRLGERTDKDF